MTRTRPIPVRVVPLLAIFVALLSPLSAEDWNAPAELRVSNTILQPNPGAWTATIGGLPGERGLWGGGAFEPLVYRTKFYAEADAADEVPIWPYHGAFFGSHKTGFWDGAEVRVYRISNGRFIKVREGRVAPGGYVASGWQVHGDTWKALVDPKAARGAASAPGVKVKPGGSLLDDPGIEEELELPVEEGLGKESARSRRLSFQTGLGGKFRPGLPYWFAVRAVDRDGRESELSNAVRVEFKGTDGSKAGAISHLVEFEWPDRVPEGTVPAAPKDLKANLEGSGLLTLTWEPVEAKNLAGYRVMVTEEAPEAHRGNHLRLQPAAGGPDEHVRRGDMVFISHVRDNFTRKTCVRPFQWSRGTEHGAYAAIGPFGDEMTGGEWALVPHPGPLPESWTDHGKLCLRVRLEGEKTFTMGRYAYSSANQSWYPVLDPEVTYVAEGWARYEGPGEGLVRFELKGTYDIAPEKGGIAPFEHKPGPEWKPFRYRFSPGFLNKDGGVGRIHWTLKGPGTFWLDNLRIYREDPGYLQPLPVVVERGIESGLEAIRFHTHIKSGWSMTMDMLTNPPGVMGSKGHNRPSSPYTLHSLLGFCRQVKCNPWLQIEMAMSEEEWLGLAEFLAAPYDPAKDTPETKPWAYKRYRMGQKRPWTEEFERIYFEISNETWNWLFGPWIFHDMTDAETGRRYLRGAAYGLWQEYVLSVFRKSPYWKETLAPRWRAVLGGWSAQSLSEYGYGPQAILHSPNTDYCTRGGYQGGWDEGEPPAEMNNECLFRSLMFWPQHEPHARMSITLREKWVAEGKAHLYGYGTYEAGPGYAMPGLNNQAPMTHEQLEAQDMIGKSQATGVATLDAFLGRASVGYTIQNFFTFNFARRYWTSHATLSRGGHPYPSWMALSLYNTQGTGDFLVVDVVRTPTADMAGFMRRRPRTNAPMIGGYATRRGDRVNLFVISRKLDHLRDEDGDGRIGGLTPKKDEGLPEEIPLETGPPITDDLLPPPSAEPGEDAAPVKLKKPAAPGKGQNKRKASPAGSWPAWDESDHGFTPVTIELPFADARSVTLYKMSGNPRRHNLDEQQVKIRRVDNVPFTGPVLRLTRATTGEAREGMPPGSVLLYVFEGVELPEANRKPTAEFEAGGTVRVGEPLAITNRSSDPDGDKLRFAWDFGGPPASTASAPRPTWEKPGRYTVRLTADDGRGGRDVGTRAVDAVVPAGGALWGWRDFGGLRGGAGLEVEADAGRLALPFGGRGRAGQLAFLAEPVGGDLTFSARVVSTTNPGRWTRVGIALRKSVDETRGWMMREASLGFAPYEGDPSRGDLVFTVGKGDDETAKKEGVRLPVHLRLERAGREVTASWSETGKEGSWQKVATLRGRLPERVFGCLTASCDRARSQGRAVFDEVATAP
jgi:hypothetical protein